MRTATIIFCLILAFPLSGQRWERLDRSFREHYSDGDYMKAGKAAAGQVNYAVEHIDSTDLRYMLSYYNLALAYHGLGSLEQARSYLGTAYNLMVPFYTLHGTELADVCELYGRIETEMGHHESAFSFLSYARDVRAAIAGKESYAYIQSLYYIADLEMARQDWEQMVAVLVEALELHEAHFSKNQDFARYANFLGLIYMNSGGNPEAAETFRWALSAYGDNGLERDLTCGHIHNNIGLASYYLSDFEQAAFHFEQADSIYRILMDGYSENYMMLLSNLASLYYSWEKPDLASDAYRRLEACLEDYPGQTDLIYIQAVENAAYFYTETGELQKAEKYHKKAIDIWQKTNPGEGRELAGKILQLGAVYTMGEFPGLAVETALEACRILSLECPPGDPDLISALVSLGYALQQSEQPNRAVYYYELAREQIELSADPTGPDAAILYNNLGTLYLMQERLAEAVPCLERAHQLEPDDPTVLYNLGYALYGMEDPEGAGEMFDRAKEVYGAIYGAGHPDYADALIMGVVSRSRFEDLGERDLEEIREAERILLESGTDTTDSRFTECLDAFRYYYMEQKEYERALGYGDRSILLTGLKYGKNSAAYAEAMLGQAGIYTRLGDREALDHIYTDAAAVASDLEGVEQESLQYVIESSKASNYYYLEDYKLARKSMEWVVRRDKSRFLENQGIMTVQELSRYSMNLTSLADYNSYLMHFPGDPEVISSAVNNRLFLKSILMDAERRQRKALAETEDPGLQALHSGYTARKRELSNLRSQFGVDRHVLDSLQQELTAMEREISRRLEMEMTVTDRTVTWQQIRDALEADEAAVEVIMFYHTTAPPVITFHPWYFAFVITRDMEGSPQCIRLFDAVEVIPEYQAYRNAVEQGGDIPFQSGLYDRLWSAIDSAVTGKRTLYFSPDGLFHELNVEALGDHDGRYILDKYQIRNVYTLADLLEEKRVYGASRTALLAGDPTFRMSLASVPDPVPGEHTRQVSEFQTRMFPGTRLSPLPGTRTEVDSIGSMLERWGWDYTLLTGADATEDAIASARSPRVLHLATHGFFAQNEVQASDTLKKGDTRSYNYEDPENQSRSCLFLAGAQNTLYFAYDYSEGRGDGILTAWEISEMELDSTELVVLSACETGLGDVLNSEGVTGLRRAFHLAGAERILLSLWEVDDQATQLLMREFYANWLSGMDMDRALAEAKRYLITSTTYTHPRYWAAFILTGI